LLDFGLDSIFTDPRPNVVRWTTSTVSAAAASHSLQGQVSIAWHGNGRKSAPPAKLAQFHDDDGDMAKRFVAAAYVSHRNIKENSASGVIEHSDSW
jgi:hypothetical protein